MFGSGQVTPDWELAQLRYKLKNLKEGEHYREDLKPTGQEKTMFPVPVPPKDKVSSAKSELTSLHFTPRMSRDFGIDLKNPKQELAKYVKSEDQILPFDAPPATMIGPGDMAARTQVALVIAGREHYVMEENLFNKSLEDQENSLDPNPNLREYDRRAQYHMARENALAETAVL